MPDEVQAAVARRGARRRRQGDRPARRRALVLRRATTSAAASTTGTRRITTDGAWDPGKDFVAQTAPDLAPTQKLMSVWRSPKPVIAQVHGWCVGGGSDFALCADLVIASEDARIGTPYSRMWGAYLSGMWIYRLGLAKAKHYALTGKPLSGIGGRRRRADQRGRPVRASSRRRSPSAPRELAAIPSSQLAAMKLMVNQAYENMGLASTQTLGPILDGLMRNTPDAHRFIEQGRARRASRRRRRPRRPVRRLQPGRQAGPEQRDRAMTDELPALDMPLDEAMMTQRAIRRLTTDPVDDALVLRLIELALKAPTGSNGQNWEFIVVRDRAVKHRLAQLNRQSWGIYGRLGKLVARNDPASQRAIKAVQWQADHFEDIPVLVVACLRGPRFPIPMAQSGYYGSIYPSVQNLLLAARAAGLGAALITLPLWSMFLARRALGLPYSVQPCAVIPLGWPKGRYGPTTRRPVGELVHLDRYGNKAFSGTRVTRPRLDSRTVVPSA